MANAFLAGQCDNHQSPSVCAITKVTSPVSREAWDSVYEVDANAMPSQSPGWAKAVVETGGYRDASRLYEFADGRRAILPLFRGRVPPGHLAMQYSPPAAWGFGGLIASDPLSAQHVRAVFEDLARLPAVSTQIRPNPLDAALWQEAAPPDWTALPRAAHVLDLEGGIEEVFAKRFRTRTRNRVRRAERGDIDIECGSDDRLISEFHTLLRLSFERWGVRQGEPKFLARWRGLRRDPVEKFQSIAKTFGPAFRLWVARIGGKPAAAIFVLQDHNAHWTRAAMDVELVGHSYANYLLHYLAIKDACQAGCNFYHMGESRRSSSIAEFKSHFGADLLDYAEYRYERLPISWIDEGARKIVKRAIGFRDA